MKCCDLHELLNNNRLWVQKMNSQSPGFFEKLSKQQAPRYLWIGCSDSRVPANEIVGLLPGELFVHRNVANVVVHTDLNCLSVIQYAVEALKVDHIIVCGHYGCGGVRAAMENRELGLMDNWLRHIQDVARRHHDELEAIADPKLRENRLCELNILEQVGNVCYTSIVQNAWKRGETLSVHGWAYDIHDGLLKELGVTITKSEDVPPAYRLV